LRRHMALPRSVGFQEVVGGSRPVIHSENNVVFSHVGFAHKTIGATVGCPVVADPPHLSAGRAYTCIAACSDALMSRKAARIELPPHPERASSRRSGPWLTSRQTPLNHTRVRNVPHRRQSAFDWLDPCLAAGRSQGRTNRSSVYDPAPSSHRTAKPAWLGHWAYRHAAITPSTRHACAPRAREKRRLSPNLCSRLIFKCTQGDIAFSGGGSHLLSSTRLPESQPVGSRPSPCKRESIAVPPFPEGTAPNGSAVGAATANRRRNIHLTWSPGVPSQLQGSLFDYHWTGCLDSRRFRVAVLSLPASRCAHSSQGPSRTPSHQERGRYGPKRLTTDKSQLVTIGLAPYRDSHEPPPYPWLCHQRHGFQRAFTVPPRDH
jgi:hypothetical protein